MADITKDYEEFLKRLSGNTETGIDFLFRIFDYIVEYPLEAFKIFIKKFTDIVKQKLYAEDTIKKYIAHFGELSD